MLGSAATDPQDRLSGVTRWVLHVDLDQFLAAVEVLRHPELKGRPVVVGGDGDPTKRGVVSTASYEAREYGVGSGVPLRTALKRCPDAVFLPVDREHYEAISDQVMDAVRSLDGTAGTVVVEPLGWDEAFIGIESDDPESVARDVQRAVREATRLDSTVGIGPNKLLAKIATGFGKPNGIYRLTHETWYDVMGDRPTDALWGIGSKTAAKLAELGIGTVRELADADVERLAARFGPTTGPWLAAVGQGRGSNRVDATPWERRSRGREVTYQVDIADWDEVVGEVRALARRVAGEVVDDGKDVVRVAVKVRYRPFFTETHSRVTPVPTRDADVIEQAALEALERFTDRRPVRLLGVRAELAG
ncbi:MAG: polymerase [Actinomycetota bacterium]|nr:polymerase [Actinomycetota bacterium]